MKPFNLEEAKAGKPICDRMERPVKFIAHIPEAKGIHKVIALDFEGEIQSYRENGVFNNHSSSLDLFMKSERKEAWVNVYHMYGKDAVYGLNCSSKEDALKNILQDYTYLDTIKIEYNIGLTRPIQAEGWRGK